MKNHEQNNHPCSDDTVRSKRISRRKKRSGHRGASALNSRASDDDGRSSILRGADKNKSVNNEKKYKQKNDGSDCNKGAIKKATLIALNFPRKLK